MNYGLLNFKAQNGKPGIFWSNEKEKKPERKFGYKTRDQRYNLRQYPTDMRTDADNLLQPVNQPEEEKPKKLATNFIKRNRDHIAKKSGKNKENDKTVTLTQEQLNAILASVGKVASGKEDALRISIDADKHEITVESPGRDGDGDHKKGRRHRDRKKKDEEQSIFALLDDKNSSRDADEKSRHRDRTPERLDSSDRHRNRKHSNDRDHHRKHSGDRDHRSDSHDRHRNHSSERHRKHSGDRYRRDSRERDRRHTPERRRHSSERHKTPSRERRRHSPDERSRERRKYSPDDRSQERRRHSKSPEDRYRKDSPSEGRYRKSTPERDERKNEKPKVEENPPSPREIAGIPVSLPWKHMTKAERRRLMLAREKVMAEETRKEEEEKRKNYQELETKLLNKNFKKDDYRRDDSRRDDQYRREDDRISDSDRGSSLKTNSLPASTTNSKVSLGELKRRQWEKERADSTTTGEFQPWGRPGAGAPIRTKSGNIAADYSKRKDQELETVYESKEHTHRRHHSSPPRAKMDPSYQRPEEDVPTQETVPAAMRSSIAFGKGADAGSMMKTKELERQKWVQELDKQREEKRMREINELNIAKASEETWADKFSNPYRPAPLPEQSVKQFGPEEHLMATEDQLDMRRTTSAPNQSIEDESKSYIRGQNVFMDPVTMKELEEKRKRHLEHQRAIMEQVQEKQRLKQQEKDRKMKEDMEEEMKLMKEKEKQQKIFETEIQKNRTREIKRQQQVENLKAAMDEAHEVAQREKYQKRMQHLEEAGHDVSHLKANLQDKPITARYPQTETARELPTTRRAKLTPRTTESTYVPGLNLETSPRGVQTEFKADKPSMALEPYIENRVLTPSQYRHGRSPKREFGTQTGNLNGYLETGHQEHRTYREMTDVDILYKVSKGKKVRVKSATKETKLPKKPPVHVNQKQPVVEKEVQEPKVTERRSRSRKKELWNYQNPANKKPVKQSEKDLNKNKRQASEHRRKLREQELLSMVEMNKDRIPTERLSRCGSHSDGEVTPRSDRLYRRNKSHSPEGHPEVNRLVISARSPEQTSRELVPYRERSPSPAVPVVRTSDRLERAHSPPVPALKHKLGGDGGFEHHGKLSKYGDSNPVTSELGNSDFVPFTRTVEILDPALATDPLPLSREATQIANARKAYIKGMKPGNYGNRVDVYEDRIRLPGESKNNNSKDPIMNPSLVKNHPTHRQDQILNQLSSLKESLIQRQRELETFSPTDLE